MWASTAASSPAPRCPLPRPRRRPLPWYSRHGLVNMVNEQHPSEVDCTWRGRQLGPRLHARKCHLITHKIMIPPADSWDPPDGPLYFTKKCFPLTAGTHQLHLRMQGSASGQKKMIRPPDCWEPPATSSHSRKCLTVGTHLVEAYVVLSLWLRTCTYILVNVEARTLCSRCAHVS